MTNGNLRYSPEYNSTDFREHSSNCTVSYSNVFAECPALSIQSFEYNSTDSKTTVPGDLKSDFAKCLLLVLPICGGLTF